MKQEDNRLNRRAFIQTAALTGSAVLLVGVPIASYVLAPAATKGTGKWVDFGSVDDLEQDEFSMLSYEFMTKDGWQVLPQRGFVWARKDISTKITVYSSTCTHLACNVIWREDKQIFECPCHSGQFNPEGRPIAGPPTKPLSTLDHKIENGNLLVYLSY